MIGAIIDECAEHYGNIGGSSANLFKGVCRSEIVIFKIAG
jgi:hypothetical protein